MTTRSPALALAALSALAGLLPSPPATADTPAPATIQWFSTWNQAAAEARRTGRPILLLAAAPQCHGISGIW